VLANVGNLIYAVYVVSLPLGPVLALHAFHLGATGLMLFWYVRHSRQRQPRHDWPSEATCPPRGWICDVGRPAVQFIAATLTEALLRCSCSNTR
jgi:hypothetical protein